MDVSQHLCKETKRFNFFLRKIRRHSLSAIMIMLSPMSTAAVHSHTIAFRWFTMACAPLHNGLGWHLKSEKKASLLILLFFSKKRKGNEVYVFFAASTSIGTELSSCFFNNRVITASTPLAWNSACSGSRLLSNESSVDPVDNKPIRLSILVKSGRSRLNLN